jgi:hypothetical protein
MLKDWNGVVSALFSWCVIGTRTYDSSGTKYKYSTQMTRAVIKLLRQLQSMAQRLLVSGCLGDGDVRASRVFLGFEKIRMSFFLCLEDLRVSCKPCLKFEQARAHVRFLVLRIQSLPSARNKIILQMTPVPSRGLYIHQTSRKRKSLTRSSLVDARIIGMRYAKAGC